MWDAQLAMWSGSGGLSPLPRASCRGIAVSLFCMALRVCWQLLEAHLTPTVKSNTGYAQNFTNLEVNEEHGRSTGESCPTRPCDHVNTPSEEEKEDLSC